ncbi:cation:proton antiporter [Bacillus sp. BRMEA1]|uniref:cation:proton antiporter n=1 Tax=Neobacillus endophyticus TaxID=2738405 RepID=UPI001567B5D6|nr:cation:proton antiporter [Neobacillus endophyticus]NRD80051.1 cation:proton antiporter [Neobacillus endophyticus]
MIEVWIILLAIAVAVAFIAEKINQPYPTLLVIAGLTVGMLPIPILDEMKNRVTNDVFFQTAIITIFLSALLGEATLKLPFKELKENNKPIIFLSILGTLLTFLFVSTASFYLLHLSIQESLVFGAVMSATDPISVLTIFKSMKLNKRLSIIVEGESLGNDGVAVVLFKISLVTTALSSAGVMHASLEFLKVVIGGIIVGAVFGFLASRITRHIDQHLIEIGLSIVLFYGSFELAEHFHVSGVISVGVAGLIFGNYGKKIGMSEQTLRHMDAFWEAIAFLANTLIFFMVGLEVMRIGLEGNWGLVLGSIAIVVLSRMAAVFLSLSFDKSVPFTWKTAIAWGGLKGSLSIALIISITPHFQGKDLLLAMTFANVLFSLLVQGTTIKFLVKIFRIYI